MSKFESSSRCLTWFMALLLSALAAGCGCGGGSGVAGLAPAVTAAAPRGAGVEINSQITATFNADMDPATISTSTFTLACPAAVPGTVAYLAASRIAVFFPAANLPTNTTCTATVTTGATGTNGIPLAGNFTWTFTTGTVLDITAPRVSATYPASNATAVPINAKVSATFNEAMAPSTITGTTFTLKQGAAAVPGTVTYASGSAVFIPADNLAANTTYTATITTGVQCLEGVAMAENYTWSWTTGTAPDATAPTVTLTVPANAATGVLINSKITATFSEAMDPLTINNLTFSVAGVSGTVAYDAIIRTATFTPADNLVTSTLYTATISTGVRCLQGVAMAENYSWRFTSFPRNYTAWSDQGIAYAVPGGDAYYPSVLYDRNGFGGSATYAMWYTDGSGAMFLATSSDGTSWSLPTTTTVFGGRAHHEQVLHDANHFGLGPSGPTYRMWYRDIGASLYDISAIATADSMDGVNWGNNTALTQDASAQLVTGAGTGWNRGSYGPVDLFYQPGAANSGDDPWSYSYIMYYDGTDGGREETGLAYSADGVFWKAYSGNPVLPVSASPAWDSGYSVYGTVYRNGIGFHFWYSGGVSAPNEGIGYAFSSDGKTWTKGSAPVFRITDGAAYRNTRTYTPSIIDDGSGTLKMYYTAVGADGVKKIGWATLPP